MNYKILIIIFTSFFLASCEAPKKTDKLNLNFSKKYKNSGFALIYSDGVDIKKKLDNRSLLIFHKTLKNKSSVKITNLKNGKSLIATVKSNKAKYSDFYNSVITTRIAETLDIDFTEPYIEVVLISKENTFIAKKSKTFDQEKKVAEKAPIDGIQISDLSKSKSKSKKIKKNENFSYSIKVADFYYKKTAQMMHDRIVNEISLKNVKIIKLSKTNYRVLIGPFDDINSLRISFEKMKSLFFENLEIIKNV